MRRKNWIVDILQCSKCRLVFRWPFDTPEELDTHYETQFAEEAPQVRLPGTLELEALQKSDFAGIWDFREKLGVLQAIKPTGRVLDYGCSWAYATWLLQQKGYEAVGFEVSRARAAYGRKHLTVQVIDSFAELESLPSGSFDVVFSHHVLEHLPTIGKTLALCTRLLRDDGVAFHILPNFTGQTARSGAWLKWIGEDHPIAPAVEFFERALPAAGLQRFQFASSPFDEKVVAALTGRSERYSQLDGDELLIVAWKSDEKGTAVTPR
ncbi:MAG: class I SAM-dependent methyltransferase [Acidobacteriia bacterium]|nr:class I SAM-dependent methyltransferase [Terriglobia bacterium]